AFASACRTWRTAFSAYPSKSTFCALFPPLLVRPNVHLHARYVPSSRDGHKLYKCQAIDPANLKTALRCHVPEKMCFAGSSYGQLICGRGLGCLIVDVFTGARISPPYLPMTEDTDFYCGMLVVCGDMLLMVDLMKRFFEDFISCKVYRLDMLTEPATWVEVEKLENYSLFVGGAVRSILFSCVSPQRWGGRSSACTIPIAPCLGACLG
ncbi:hypothetical protein BAE44_0012236, partial [Dichanthelium oligosanthes]